MGPVIDAGIVAETARQLRSILAAIERCEVEATAPQVAYISGAANTLESLFSGEQPSASV